MHLIGTRHIQSILVTAEVRGLVETGLPTVFEPRNALITEPGLYLEDSLVEPDPDGRVCLVIHNFHRRKQSNSCHWECVTL